jgi:hypothetical protein
MPMKAIVVHDPSGRIKTVAFVADDVGYEGDSQEHVIELEPEKIGLTLERGPKPDRERLHEHARKVVEEFRVVHGTVVRR